MTVKTHILVERRRHPIPAYNRALELKPKYARGWLNLGISHANLGKYDLAARSYLKALDLNNNAHIWISAFNIFSCVWRGRTFWPIEADF